MSSTEDRLLILVKAILRTLYEREVGANELMQQTGSKDRSYFFDKLKSMKKEKLIIQTRTGKGPGHKIIQSLSDTGKEISGLYKAIENFQASHNAFRQVRLSNFDKSIIPIKHLDENNIPIPLDIKRALDHRNSPILGAVTVEELSFDYFNKLVFYKCGQILAKVPANSRVTKILINDIMTIMVSEYSEQIKHMMNVNDPGAIQGLDTQKDLIFGLVQISADLLLLKDPRIGNETRMLLDCIFSIIKHSKFDIEEQIKLVEKKLIERTYVKGNELKYENFDLAKMYYEKLLNQPIIT